MTSGLGPDEILIDVRQAQSVEQVESLLDVLTKARRTTAFIDLRVPLRLKSSWMGGQAAVMQLAGHWARHCSERGVLRTYYAADVTQTQLVLDLEKYEHFFFAICVAPRIYSRDRKTDITVRVRGAARQVLANWQDRGPDRRMRSLVELVSDDWPDLAPRSLYKRGDSRYPMELKDEYLPLADRILSLSQRPSSMAQDPKLVSSLSWALLELFQNTDQWAKSLPSSSGDKEATPSCRVILARWITFEAEKAPKYVGDSPSLLRFLDQSLEKSESRHRFFEISVLDMGPGLAGWRAAERGLGSQSVEDEVRDLRWSLARRRTTSLDPTKGMGFHRAFLNLTRLGGYVQIRSGQVAAFRNFSEDPYPTDREAADAALPSESRSNYTMISNWVEAAGPRSEPVARQVGTRVTMLIPDRPRRTDV